jgi:hypothetical protein
MSEVWSWTETCKCKPKAREEEPIDPCLDPCCAREVQDRRKADKIRARLSAIDRTRLAEERRARAVGAVDGSAASETLDSVADYEALAMLRLEGRSAIFRGCGASRCVGGRLVARSSRHPTVGMKHPARGVWFARACPRSPRETPGRVTPAHSAARAPLSPKAARTDAPFSARCRTHARGSWSRLGLGGAARPSRPRTLAASPPPPRA